MFRKRAAVEHADLAMAVEQAADGVVITDLKGIIQYVNPAFTRMTGYTSEEAIGQHTRILKSGLMPQERYAELWSAVVSGRVWSGALINRRKDATLYDEEMRISPVHDANGDVVSFIAFKHDITERLRHEREKADLLRKLDEAVRDLGKVQAAMLRSTPDVCEINVHLCFHPKHAAGGDFLCHYPLPDGREVVLLTDVSGHDLKAAYYAAHSQGMVKAMLDCGVSLDGVFENLNGDLFKRSSNENDMGVSMSACAMVFDKPNLTVAVRNCGAPLPVHVDATGLPKVLRTRSGFPLGWFASLTSETASFPLADGFVLAWTDGLEDLAFDRKVTPLTMAMALLRCKAAQENCSWLEHAKDDVMVACVPLSPDQLPILEQWLPLFDDCYGCDQVARIDELRDAWSRNIQFAIPEIGSQSMSDILLRTREAVLNRLLQGSAQGELTRVSIRYRPAAGKVVVTVGTEPKNGAILRMEFDV